MAEGFVTSEGKKGGGWQKPPSVPWKITDAGRDRLGQRPAA
jgi:hypothetical protein